MFCLKCGEAIPDGSAICPYCGADLFEQDTNQTIVYASQKEVQTSEVQQEPKKRTPRWIIWTIAAVACVIVIYLVVNGISRANLKKALVKEWYNVDDTILLVLDISDHEIEYRCEGSYTGTYVVDTFEWKPISANKIKINYSDDLSLTCTVELSDEGNMFTVSPAITSTDLSESWYYIY